jgi:hypothetical protein
MQKAMYAIQFFNYFSAAIGVVLSLFVEVDYLPILFFVLNVLYGIAVIIANTALFLDWEMNSRIYQHGLKGIAIAAVFVVIGQVLIVFSLLKSLSWYQ